MNFSERVDDCFEVDRSYFDRPADELAKQLLGDYLVSSTGGTRTGGRIIETEAYVSEGDDANHAVQSGKTDRNRSMFGPPGITYVYRIYGMYDCLNVVCGDRGVPEAVLIRAVKPLFGVELMRQRREKNRSSTVSNQELSSGPGKLSMALGITTLHDGMDLTSGESLQVFGGPTPNPEEITTGPRVGVEYADRASDWPLRFQKK